MSQVQAGGRTPQATVSRFSPTEVANVARVSNIAPGSADLNDIDSATDREIGQLPSFLLQPIRTVAGEMWKARRLRNLCRFRIPKLCTGGGTFF